MIETVLIRRRWPIASGKRYRIIEGYGQILKGDVAPKNTLPDEPEAVFIGWYKAGDEIQLSGQNFSIHAMTNTKVESIPVGGTLSPLIDVEGMLEHAWHNVHSDAITTVAYYIHSVSKYVDMKTVSVPNVCVRAATGYTIETASRMWNKLTERNAIRRSGTAEFEINDEEIAKIINRRNEKAA